MRESARATPVARPARRSIIRDKEAQSQLHSALLDGYSQGNGVHFGAETPIISCDGGAVGRGEDIVDFESCISLASYSTLTGRDAAPPGDEELMPLTTESSPANGGGVQAVPKALPPPAAKEEKVYRKFPKNLAHFDHKQKCKSKLLDEWKFLREENISHLQSGGSLYNFICAPGPELPPAVMDDITSFINLSSFDDELRARPIDMSNPEDLGAHVFILNKAFYSMPHPVDVTHLTPEILSSVKYQRACQPRKPKIWENVTDENTFRFTKSIIPFVYSITVQLKVSEIPRKHWERLSDDLYEGYEIHHALLLERTTRDIHYKDATRSVKSLLLFHIPEGGGALVASITAIANTVLPTMVAKVVDTFGSSGAVEVAETADLTRKHLVAAMY
eukprot:TRINITY_DN65774_c0_g1_i1.p1 TRINITY_DN65774_c0_g1~~TRINITY_DN65774_c0_g1_i1.p1  ORF type:complete len:406 (+),score=97.45 TRINITY_DN65774_c0_g1_i1:51-1220(+)